MARVSTIWFSAARSSHGRLYGPGSIVIDSRWLIYSVTQEAQSAVGGCE